MESLPTELLFELLLKVSSVEDVMKMCRTNKSLNRICQDDYFWRKRLEKDYPHLVTLNSTMNFKDRYQWIYDTGIGSNIEIDFESLNSEIMSFIVPRPPYSVIDIFINPNVHIYQLAADCQIIPFEGGWNIVYFDRSDDIETRLSKTYMLEPDDIVTTVEELKEVIDDLFVLGFCPVKINMQADTYLNLQRRGLVSNLFESKDLLVMDL